MPAPSLEPQEIARLHAVLDRMGAGTQTDVKTLVAAATTALSLHRFDDALAIARAALVADPKSARAWSVAGHALDGLSRLEEARRALETAVSLDDDDLLTALACADVQARTGAVSQARALLNFILMKEREAPDLRARAEKLLAALGADDDEGDDA